MKKILSICSFVFVCIMQTASPLYAGTGHIYDTDSLKIKKRFLPVINRIDREINKNKYAYKGEFVVGFTASYGTLNSEEADMFPIFENIDLNGNVASVNPFAGYFYKDDNCVGVRFGYSHLSGTLDALGINLGEQNDLEIDIPWIDFSSNRYSGGVFLRSYVALDNKGCFGLFGELEGAYIAGNNKFAYKSGDRYKFTESKTSTAKIMFNPGAAVYAFPNMCVTLSFGLGGFKYTHIKQFDTEGNKVGERQYSKLNFRLNLADIRIGMVMHLWNKKKDSKLVQK